MSTQRLVHAIALLAVFAMAARISVDTDTWWHLRAGEWMVENREILRQDPFSYTRYGEPWNYPGWLVEVPMYLIYRVSGPGGLNLWTAAMVTIAFGFCWATLSGGPFLRAFTIILAAAASGVYWAARPYLVTFVLAAIFLWVLEDFRWRRKDRLIWLPLLMVIWSNSHGGFAIGLILTGIYCLDLAIGAVIGRFLRATRPSSAEDRLRLRKITIIGIASVAAIAINPFGPEMLLYPFKTVSIGALQDFIAEWQSPNFHELRVQPFLWLILLTFGAVGFSRQRLTISDFLLVTVFSILGLTAARNIALFALASPPVLTRHADHIVQAWRRRLGVRIKLSPSGTQSRAFRAANSLILITFLTAVGIKTATILPENVNLKHFRATYPIGAVAYLEERSPEGQLFNSYNWGGYLLWTLPDYPVFIDGRTDLFDDEIIESWMQVIRAEGDWAQILDTWGVNLVLLEPDYPLAAELRANDWRLLHEDEISVLFEKP